MSKNKANTIIRGLLKSEIKVHVMPLNVLNKIEQGDKSRDNDYMFLFIDICYISVGNECSFPF
jgi:hypothetical protein